MGVNYNPKIVTDGLQISLDWGNPKCYLGSGTTFTNLVNSNVNNGYLKGNAVFNSNNGGVIETGGYNNGATNFVGDRIDIETSSAGRDRFSGTNNFSVTFWHYWISGSGKFWSTGSSGSTGTDACIWQMWIDSSRFYWWNGGGGSANNLQASFNGTRVTNAWQHIGLTYSYNQSGNNIARVYVDGVNVGTGTRSTDTHSYRDRSNQTNLQWTLGGGYSSSCRTSNSAGRFALFNLFNKKLSDAEINQIFNASKKRFKI